MGLDMILLKETRVTNCSDTPPEDQYEVVVSRGGCPYESIKLERVTRVVELVAKWRKANAIHNWFVQNVQDGEDDCDSYPVSVAQLQKLIDLCKEVLTKVETVDGELHERDVEDVASSLLPTVSGFFFGSTDYDEDYTADLQSTVEQLEPLLSGCQGDVDFYYCASW